MQTGLYVSLSAQMAMEKRLETIARNVANMNTVGYRADGVTFQSHLDRAEQQDSVAFASAGDTYISRAKGELTQTGDPLDVAVRGDAWLAIGGPSGPVYTRDGRMRMGQSGELQTLNGYPVLDVGGAPIVLDTTTGPPTIAGDGMITQNGTEIGALGLFTIAANAKLTRFENSGVIPDRSANPVVDFTTDGVAQGFVEGANVNPVTEMMRLITVQRAFESANSMIEQSESSVSDSIKTLGETS